ncbi:MAG: enoyl-CoA hydratase/isomerase family protein [Pirellulales bacterium]
MSSAYESIAYDVQGGVARITLNRPPLNILNLAMIQEINSALEALGSTDDARLLVIDHEGKAFSAGVDIKDHTADKVDAMIGLFHRMFRLLNALEVPTLAVVHGAALGGGCELATFCDMAVASEQAKFGQPEIKAGVFPPVAAVILPHLIGRNRALELLLTGDVVGAERAEQMGLINQVFPADTFREKVDEFIARLTSLSAPVLKLTKRAVDRGLHATFDEAISRVEEIYLGELMQTEDAQEGLRAFLEKRKPEWKDK